MTRARVIGALAAASLVVAAVGAAPQTGEAPRVVESLVAIDAADGTHLEGKLSIPAGAAAPVPVVFYLHGAGPTDYDHAVRFRDTDGQIRETRYYDYFARELSRLGLGFFRISKRGCTKDVNGRLAVDRTVFAKATPTVLVSDYIRGLDALRQRADVDATRIVLMGASEGTRLAPRVALDAPSGIVGLVLTSFQEDNQHDTVVWQNTIGPWRAVTSMVPGASDGRLTRAAYDAAVRTDPTIAARLPFAALDTDKDGALTDQELTSVVRPRLDAILKAVATHDDDFLWTNLLNLSSAYLLDGWDSEPTHAWLLKVGVPIAILHGIQDGTTRVEGVEETAAAFQLAGRPNLIVRTYDGYDHDLGWTPAGAAGEGPAPLRDALTLAAKFAGLKPRAR